MKRVKIVACDIDGTLCEKGEDLSPLTREGLKRLHEEGVLVGLASGRPADSHILSKAEEWNLGFSFDFAIGMNGGELFDAKTNQLEKYYLLSPEHIREILTFLEPYDINAIVYTNGYAEVRCLRMDDFMKESKARNHSDVIVGDIDTLSEFATGKIEVQFKEEDRDAILKVIKEHQNPAWSIVQTFRGFGRCTFEFQDPHVNKGVALEKYGEKYNISMDDVMTFGDQENDIGLMKSAGTGVCLKNGADLTKSFAKYITEYDVDHDGVGRWLCDHYFNEEN